MPGFFLGGSDAESKLVLERSRAKEAGRGARAGGRGAGVIRTLGRQYYVFYVLYFIIIIPVKILSIPGMHARVRARTHLCLRVRGSQRDPLEGGHQPLFEVVLNSGSQNTVNNCW